MAERKTYDDVVTLCVVCGEEVPAGRAARGSITCKPEHAELREKRLRERKNNTECRYCHRPSTLEERAAFLLFKKLARKRPDLLYPAEFEAWKKILLGTWKEEAVRLGQPEVDEKSDAISIKLIDGFLAYYKDDDADERPIGPAAAKAEPMQERNDDSIYIYIGDSFSKKGHACRMLKTRSKVTNVVQIRFEDGFCPLVARSTLRLPSGEERKNLLDENGNIRSTLLASGKPTAGE